APLQGHRDARRPAARAAAAGRAEGLDRRHDAGAGDARVRGPLVARGPRRRTRALSSVLVTNGVPSMSPGQPSRPMTVPRGTPSPTVSSVATTSSVIL